MSSTLSLCAPWELFQKYSGDDFLNLSCTLCLEWLILQDITIGAYFSKAMTSALR